MSAAIIPFNAALKRSNGIPKPSQNSACSIELPSRLAQKIAEAALWEGKTAEQFVLAMLQAAFPDQAGAA